MALTPQQIAQKWETNSSAATTRYQQGVANTTKDVVGNAIAKQSTLLSNFTESVTSGRWARRLSESGGTANWKAKTQAKAANYGTGVAAAASTVQDAFTKLMPYIQAGQSAIDAMPSGTLAASKARATAWIDYMAAYKAQS